jgi:hypothetical protein
MVFSLGFEDSILLVADFRPLLSIRGRRRSAAFGGFHGKRRELSLELLAATPGADGWMPRADERFELTPAVAAHEIE